MKGMKAFLSATAIFASLGLANAQLSELESTKNGTGTLSFATRSSNTRISQVRVSLRRNGTADIRVAGSDTFSGTWRNDGSRSVRINLDRYGRDRADGSGTIQLDGRGSFREIDLNGKVDGASFRLSFDTNDSSGGGSGDWSQAMRATRNGWGTLRYRTRSSNNQINRLSVDLKRDGGFEIRILSGSNETFKGRWTADYVRLSFAARLAG